MHIEDFREYGKQTADQLRANAEMMARAFENKNYSLEELITALNAYSGLINDKLNYLQAIATQALKQVT